MPKSVRSFDRITIPAPCDADWEAMSGNDQVRFCEHCNLQFRAFALQAPTHCIRRPRRLAAPANGEGL